MNYLAKGKYEGEMVEGWYHGNGKFKYDNGVVYEGSFSKGLFHGDGILHYPNGGKYIGKWNNGIMTDGRYEFSDGLQFENSSKWDYCTYKDRRFYHEIINNIKNPNVNEFNKRVFKEIPEGTYDSGDGYYDPEKGTIFTYDNDFLRIPNEDEEEWIKLKCRYNPKKSELEDIDVQNDGTNDEVIQNILREYKFKGYTKGGNENNAFKDLF